MPIYRPSRQGHGRHRQTAGGRWGFCSQSANGVLGSFFLGANFLDYGVFSDDFKSGQLVGIFLVELGVGITVSATMISIFLAFREWKTDE